MVKSNSPEPSAILVFLGVFEGLTGVGKVSDSLVKESDIGAPCCTAIVDRIIGSMHAPVADLALYHPSSRAKAVGD